MVVITHWSGIEKELCLVTWKRLSLDVGSIEKVWVEEDGKDAEYVEIYREFLCQGTIVLERGLHCGCAVESEGSNILFSMQ